MRVLIKNTPVSAQRLYDVNVPVDVIDAIIGKEVEADADLNVEAPFVGQITKWNIPAECVTIIAK